MFVRFVAQVSGRIRLRLAGQMCYTWGSSGATADTTVVPGADLEKGRSARDRSAENEPEETWRSMARKRVRRKRSTSEKIMIVFGILIALSMIFSLFVGLGGGGFGS